MAWTSEEICDTAEAWFLALQKSIEGASLSIEFEMYIFESQGLPGRPLLEALKRAAERGVKVRVLVDGIGSPSWMDPLVRSQWDPPLELRVFHPVPWPYSRWHVSKTPSLRRFFSLMARLNTRTHKKLVVIDRKEAFIGSMNVWEQSLKWREMGVKVKGPGVETLWSSFERNWRRSYDPNHPLDRFIPDWKRLRMQPLDTVLLSGVKRFASFRRRLTRKKLLEAHSRVWLVTPYFLPSWRFTRGLCRAAERGVDVRLMVSETSDVKIFQWLLPIVLQPLLKAGVRVFAYRPRILHAKFSLVDKWLVVGSSNLNQRSLRRDLEVDVVLHRPESINQMEAIFLRDEQECLEWTMELLDRRPWTQKLLGRFFLLWKAFL